jgi:coenzyme F420-0:L-glutamate ligase
MKSLTITPVKTSILHLNENLADFIDKQIPKELIRESMVLAVTSKIVSLSEGQIVKHDQIDKHALIEQEADVNLGEVGYGCYLTIKQGLFIASAGIDESNSESGDYILYPKDPFQSAKNIWSVLRKKWSLKNLGIILTDSHTTPLRRGVTGISLSYWGFKGLKNMIGTEDLFGRKLAMTTINLADGLAGAATLMMGEGNEATPLAIISGADVEFAEEIDSKEVQIPMRDDLYFPFFKHLVDKN